MRSKILALCSIGLFALSNAYGQLELSMYGMQSVPQSSVYNPALTPDSKTWFSTPLLGEVKGGAYHNGFAWNDLIFNSGAKQQLTFERALARMKDVNSFDVRASQELLGFGFKSGNSYFGFSTRHSSSAGFGYPKDLLEFVYKGNGHPDVIGRRMSLDGLGINMMSYLSTGVTYTYSDGGKFSYGGSLRYLTGLGYIETMNSDIGITTNDQTYAISVDGSYDIVAAGIGSVVEQDSTTEVLDYLNAKSIGFGLDLGALYQLNDKIKLSASMTDLGMIKWANGKRIFSDTVDVTFEGVEFDDVFSPTAGEEPESQLQELLDTIQQQLEPQIGNADVKSRLRTNFYLGGTYQVIEGGYATVLFAGQAHPVNFKTALRLGYTQLVNDFLEVKLSYNIYGRSYKSLGAGFAINGGPFQVYFVSDNFISLFAPAKHKNLHAQLGINFVFKRSATSR